jgi:hypothetical protein
MLVSILPHAAQVDVYEGKNMCIPVTTSTLVEDQGLELVSREQRITP